MTQEVGSRHHYHFDCLLFEYGSAKKVHCYYGPSVAVLYISGPALPEVHQESGHPTLRHPAGKENLWQEHFG